MERAVPPSIHSCFILSAGRSFNFCELVSHYTIFSFALYYR
jgi:hypothetical protein